MIFDDPGSLINFERDGSIVQEIGEIYETPGFEGNTTPEEIKEDMVRQMELTANGFEQLWDYVNKITS